MEIYFYSTPVKYSRGESSSGLYLYFLAITYTIQTGRSEINKWYTSPHVLLKRKLKTAYKLFFEKPGE